MFNTEEQIRMEGLESFGRYYSTYEGIIADRKDPEKRGRVKVKVPALWGNQVHDYWALPKGMQYNNGVGDFHIPPVDAKVWIEFSGGNQEYPIWSYGIAAKSDTTIADLYGVDGEPVGKVIATMAGHTLILDDTGSKVTLQHAGGNRIVMTAGSILIGNDEILEPAMLGNQWKAIMETLIDSLIAITVANPAGLTSTPLNAADIAVIKLDLMSALSQIIKHQ